VEGAAVGDAGRKILWGFVFHVAGILYPSLPVVPI
jgi:hypothetical protein